MAAAAGASADEILALPDSAEVVSCTLFVNDKENYCKNFVFEVD